MSKLAEPNIVSRLARTLSRRLVLCLLSMPILGLVMVEIASTSSLAQTVIRSGVSSVSLREVAIVRLKSSRSGGSSVLSLAWSVDGRRLAVSFDWGYQVAVLDTSNWKEVSRFGGKTFNPERTMAFLSETEILTYPEENTQASPWAAEIYDSETGHVLRQIARPPGHANASTRGVIVPWGRRVFGIKVGSKVLLFDAKTTEFVSTLATPPDASIWAMAPGPGDQLAMALIFPLERARLQVRKPVYLLDALKNEITGVLPGHVPGVQSVSWSPDGRFIASGVSMLTSDGERKWIRDTDPVRVWDAMTQQLVVSFEGEFDPVNAISWHPSSALFATVSAKENPQLGYALRLWSLSARKLIFEYAAPGNGDFTALSFNPRTGQLALAWGGALHVYEVVGL